MRILSLLPCLPHPTMRGELRHYHLLRGLAARHTVTAAAFTKVSPTAEALRDYNNLLERLMVFDASDRPATGGGRSRLGGLQARLARHRRVDQARLAMRRMVEQLAPDSFDVVLAYDVELKPVLQGLRGAPLVLDLCDASSSRLRQRMEYVSALERPWRWFRWQQTVRAEQQLVKRADRVLFVSARDRRAVGAPANSEVVPNGIDSLYWQRTTPFSMVSRVVFTGVMDYPPNDDGAMYLLRDIAPLVRARIPELEVVIAGRNPSSRLMAEAARHTGVSVTGFVDDLRPVLEGAAVFVAPLRFASGMQNKVLEAMAMELPVVATSVVNEGLRTSDAATPAIVADTAAETADRLVELLRNATQRVAVGQTSRRFVTDTFTWIDSVNRIERACLEQAHRRQQHDDRPRRNHGLAEELHAR